MGIILHAAQLVTFVDAYYGIYMSILLVLCTYTNILEILSWLPH
jgi:hypothetical protein